MPFAKGNKAAAGHDGSNTGRKSAYSEFQDAKFMDEVWRNAQDVEKLEEQVRSKHYSVRDITVLRVLKGSERLMTKFMDKLVPDLHDVTTGGKPLFLPSELMNKHQLTNGTPRDTETSSE